MSGVTEATSRPDPGWCATSRARASDVPSRTGPERSPQASRRHLTRCKRSARPFMRNSVLNCQRCPIHEEAVANAMEWHFSVNEASHARAAARAASGRDARQLKHEELRTRSENLEGKSEP